MPFRVESAGKSPLSVLALESTGDPEPDLIPKSRQVSCDPEVTPIDRSGRLESDRICFVDRVDTGPDQTDVQNDLLGDAAQGQVARDQRTARLRLDPGGNKGRLGKFARIEPFVTFE